MLDTKNFTSRVTSRTFDVASYQEHVEVIVLLSRNWQLLISKYGLVNELSYKDKGCKQPLVAQAKDTNEYDTVVISKAADTLC